MKSSRGIENVNRKTGLACHIGQGARGKRHFPLDRYLISFYVFSAPKRNSLPREPLAGGPFPTAKMSVPESRPGLYCGDAKRGKGVFLFRKEKENGLSFCSAAMLKVTNIEKHFGGVKALQGCTIEVQEGTITGLIGPNGAGKTTLFNVISGMLRPDRGKIELQGKRIDGLPPHRIARFGLLRTFQISRGLRRMTVLDNLMVYPQSQVGENLWNIWVRWGRVKEQEKKLREKALQTLEFVHLIHLQNAYAEELSGGQKRLLELARVLMASPRIVLLDEPGAGVNPALMKVLVSRILQLRDQGVTFLLIEHDMDLVLSLCHPVIVLTEGKKLTDGAFEEVRKDPRVLEAYLGRKH